MSSSSTSDSTSTRSGARSSAGSGASPRSSTRSGSENQDNTEIREIEDPPTSIEPTNSSNTGISKAIDKFTLDGEPIKSKYKIFKNI